MLKRERTRLAITIARMLAGGDRIGWIEHLREAEEIIEEAREVIEWRFGYAFEDRTLHLAKLLAAEHVRRETKGSA